MDDRGRGQSRSTVGQNLHILYITGHLYDLDGYEKWRGFGLCRWRPLGFSNFLVIDIHYADRVQSFNPRQLRGLLQPHMSFLSWTPHRLEYRAEIFRSLWGIFCTTLAKKWSSQVRSRSYHVIRGTTFDKISAKSWVNATWRGANDLNGYSWCDCVNAWLAVAHDPCIIWVLRSIKVTWGHWPRLTSQWPIANRHMFSGVSWGAESEFVVHCSQKRS